jgi:hypothetical protein
MAKVVVRFDRELRQLEPDDAAARRVWLTQHRLNGLDIACPSTLTYIARRGGSRPG